MKKLFFIVAYLFLSVSVFAGNYSFSIVKAGVGKQAILFIPGFASSGDVWKETVDRLKDNYTCYVLTMAGFAGVTPQAEPSFESWKREIAQFIEDEKIEKPILVGHSMGGGLALAIASDFPYLPCKLVIVDALPCLMALTDMNFKSVPDKDCRDMTKRITDMDEMQFARMQRAGVAGLTINSSRFEEILSWGLTSDRKTYARMYCDFSNTDLRERIKHIIVPTLILLEPAFRNMDSVVKGQYRGLSAAQLRYADKGLHFIMFDDKEWYLEQLLQFIKE